MVSFKVKYDEVEIRFNKGPLTEIREIVSEAKVSFEIEQSCRGSLKLDGKTLGSKSKLKETKVKNGSVLIFSTTGKAVTKASEFSKITFDIQFGNQTTTFENQSDGMRVSVLMGLAKNRFDFESSAKQHHFELKGQPISDKISLKEAKFTNGSKLKLLKGQQKSKTVEHETRDLGLDEPLTFTSIRSHLVKVYSQAGLYAILDKKSKSERQQIKKPLKLIRTIGIVTGMSFENRFKKYCNDKKSIFNIDDHCIMPIKQITDEDKDPRFETCMDEVVAYELLSDTLRNECSFLSSWQPGTGFKPADARAFNKLRLPQEQTEFARKLIELIRSYED